jgi:ABC-type nitrate/sulfonate/bicarbonate transport system substrate-binding protein
VDAAELFGLYGNLARENPEIRVLYDTASEWHALTKTWPMHHVLATYRDIVKETPELPKRLLGVFNASRDYARENFNLLIDLYLKEFDGNRENLLSQVKPEELGAHYSWSLSDEEERTIRTVHDFCKEFGFIKGSYALDALVCGAH